MNQNVPNQLIIRVTLLARPTELIGIGMNQSVSNFALLSDNQFQPFPNRDSDGLDAYARQPSVTLAASSSPGPEVARCAEEIFGSHNRGSAPNMVTSPSTTSRNYRYRVVYDYLLSDWYVCDCESATFERMGWVDTSEVLRKHCDFRVRSMM